MLPGARVKAAIDPKLPVLPGMKTSDLVKAMVGLLALGKSDFEAIEPFRHDRFFKEALGITKVPSSVWMRQRLDAKGAELRELTDELTLRLLERTQAPITAYQGYVCADLDTFVMDNSDTKKEAVSRTYQGVDGYSPIALYLGNEGWNIGLELRPGSHHSVLETEYFLERVFPRLERLCPQDAKVLLRADSGFDSARLFAPAGAVGADRRDYADPSSGQAAKDQDGAAGDHVPGGAARCPCEETGAGLWMQRCRTRQGVRCAARTPLASSFAMSAAQRLLSTETAGSAPVEGRDSSRSRKMTSRRPARDDFRGRNKAIIAYRKTFVRSITRVARLKIHAQ